MLTNSGAPTVWFLDDFKDTAAYCAQIRDVELRLGVHFTVQSLCSLLPFIGRPHVTQIWRRHDRGRLGAVVRDVVAAFRLNVGEDVIADICRYMTGDDAAPKEALIEDCLAKVIDNARPVGAHRSVLSSSDRRMLEDVMGGYEALFEGRREVFLWPTPFFVSGVAPYGAILGPVDMTGPARCLAFGPQLHMPVGRWTVRAVFGVTQNFSGNILKVDVLSGGNVIAEADMELPVNGRLVFSLAFENRSATAPIDLRFTIMTGAIEGNFELLGVAAEPAVA